MAIVGLVLIVGSTVAAFGGDARKPDLRPSPFRVIGDSTSLIEHSHRRSPYLLPKAELPAEDADDDGIQVRWKLKKIKVKVPLGAS